jgi:hypothetical protein
MKGLRWGLVLLAGVLSALGGSQQGGMMGGDLQDRSGESKFPGRRSEGSSNFRGFSSRNFLLTPGDKVEVKFQVKAGQTLFATAESTAFDAALEVQDANGLKQVENDDQTEGDQSPYIAWYFEKEGEYKLIVKNYRSASGGQFTLNTMLVNTLDLKMNRFQYSVSKASDGGNLLGFARLKVAKDKFYAVINPRVEGIGFREVGFSNMVGPSGVSHKDYTRLGYQGDAFVFRALKDGYAYYRFSPFKHDSSFSATFAEIPVETVTADSNTNFSLAPNTGKILRMPVKQAEGVVSTIETNLINTWQQFVAPEGREGEGRFEGVRFHWIPARTSSGKTGLRIFAEPHDVYQIFISTSDQNESVRVSHSNKIPEFSAGSRLDESLELGETKFYRVRTKRFERHYFSGESGDLELKVDRIGQEVVPISAVNPITHQPLFDIGSETSDTEWILAIGSAGGGGKGRFSLKSRVTVPIAVELNKVYNQPQDATARHSVNLKAGIPYIVTIDQDDSDFGIVAPNGTELEQTRISAGNAKAFIVTPFTDGLYIFRVSANAKNWKFSIRPYQIKLTDGH